MKKKYLAAILGIMMATASVTACGAATTETTTNTAESSDNKGTEDTTAESAESTDDSDSSADADKEDSDEEDVTYGEVKSVEDGKITIAVGTMKDMGGNGGAPEKPDENGSGDASADTSDAESTESDSKAERRLLRWRLCPALAPNRSLGSGYPRSGRFDCVCHLYVGRRAENPHSVCKTNSRTKNVRRAELQSSDQAQHVRRYADHLCQHDHFSSDYDHAVCRCLFE